jgi:hypothetical protein
MGRKLNPTYRAKLAERQKLPSCAFCGIRGRYLPVYPDPETGEELHYHLSCYEKDVAKYAAEQEVTAEQRERHMAFKDYWNNPPAWQPADGVPGSGEYNAKCGCER